MSGRSLLSILGAFIVVAGALAGCTSARGDVPRGPQPADVELAATARRVFDIYEQQNMANEPLTPEFIERYCLASERLAEAEEAARGDPEAAARALTEHASRLEDFQSQMSRVRDGSPHMTAIVDYFRARAGVRLAQRRLRK